MVVVNLALGLAFEVLPGMAGERVVYYRESASKAYSAFPYMAAQALVQVPVYTLQTALYRQVNGGSHAYV